MEIRDRVEVISSEHYTSGTPHSAMNIYTSVNDKPISRLLKILNSKGIIISQENSEKIIEYDISLVGGGNGGGNKKRESFLPLCINFNHRKYLVGYILRNPNLRIDLKDFFNSEYTGMPGSFGAESKVTTGVVADIFYSGINHEKANSDIMNVKKIITEFYKSKIKPFKINKKTKVKVIVVPKAKSKK